MDYQNCPIDQVAPRSFPPQHQDYQPGLEYQMEPRPISECGRSSQKLRGQVALITGGDSGIGRAVAYAFVKEGAKVVIVYYNEDQDAQETAGRIRELGGECLLLRGDLKDPAFAKRCVEQAVEHFGALDILVNNHAVQFVQRNHHADRNTVCTNRDERVQTNGRLSYKIKMGRKHTTTHGRMSRRLLPEFKPVYESVLGPPFQAQISGALSPDTKDCINTC